MSMAQDRPPGDPSAGGATEAVGSPAANRRGFPRVKGPFDGTWTGAAGAGMARVWDLSVGGCYIDALNGQRPGERVSVQISLPEGIVALDGEVVYSLYNQGFALRFLDVSEEAAFVLQRAVDRLRAAGQEV